MPKKLLSPILSLALLAVVAAGCKPQPAEEPASTSGIFQTPFQNESEYVVQAVIADLAEQMVFAATRQIPPPDQCRVVAREKAGSPQDAPVFEVQVQLIPKKAPLKFELSVEGCIWSPALYQAAAEKLARAVHLNVGKPADASDSSFFAPWTEATAEKIEQQNLELSEALQKDFTNSTLHEQAAALLGMFLLRDHSGAFFEIRSPLCRMAAHLIMAQYLRGSDAPGRNGQMAEAMLLTLIKAQTPALERLKAFGANDVAAAALVRALRTRNTGDYRLLQQSDGRSPLESVEWFGAAAGYGSAPMAWLELGEQQKQTIDFIRVANEESYSVEMGHELIAVALTLELREIQTVYALSHPGKLTRQELVKALNEPPEYCFCRKPDGKRGVCVIGWGQWACFLQRHFCHALHQSYVLLQHKWGVPEDAAQFTDACNKQYADLRLYPFVRRFMCTNEATYHSAVDDGLKVTIATPHLVPAGCWNYLSFKPRFAPQYGANPHINEWHNHNPLPGTLYDLGPRLYHPSLISRPDAIARFELLHQLAPYDCRPCNWLLSNKYTNHASYLQAMSLYSSVLPYSATALQNVAELVTNVSEQYEQLMTQAGELNPVNYYTLGHYFDSRGQKDKAAQYFEKACASDPDAVRIASLAMWRVNYYLSKGQTDQARAIADHGGEVYSYKGLEAKAWFFESTSNYDSAFDWYAKIEERYDDAWPLINFCLRQRMPDTSPRYAEVLNKHIKGIFPKGMEKVSLADFKTAPDYGVLVNEESDLVKAAGMKAGDIIVAAYGVRVYDIGQYSYARYLKDTPELDLIVWQGGAYHELKPSPPAHRFRADFRNYRAR